MARKGWDRENVEDDDEEVLVPYIVYLSEKDSAGIKILACELEVLNSGGLMIYGKDGMDLAFFKDWSYYVREEAVFHED